MFLGTPLEEPFRVVVWLFIGLPILALILWVGLQLLLINLTAMALVWAVTLAMVGYLLGIPGPSPGPSPTATEGPPRNTSPAGRRG